MNNQEDYYSFLADLYDSVMPTRTHLRPMIGEGKELYITKNGVTEHWIVPVGPRNAWTDSIQGYPITGPTDDVGMIEDVGVPFHVVQDYGV